MKREWIVRTGILCAAVVMVMMFSACAGRVMPDSIESETAAAPETGRIARGRTPIRVITGSDTGKTESPGQGQASANSEPVSAEDALLASDLIAANIQRVFPVFSGEGKNASDAAVPYLLTQAADTLLRYAEFSGRIPAPDSLTVILLETDEINSFSAGNRYIFVTRGLLNILDSQIQYTAVLSHEIAHMSLGHTLAMLDTSSPERLQGSAEQCLYTVMGGYAADAEFSADAETIALLSRAGVDKNAFIDFLKILVQIPDSEQPDIIQTHPHIFQRIANLSNK